MKKRDYYEVLNLTPSCTPNDVRQNYKKLALKWHPDKCSETHGANSRFNEIQEAYSILSNSRKKEIYDMYGHQGVTHDQENGDVSDIFNKRKNFFFEKGFQGTEKCAYDVLKDILQEKDDSDFFSNLGNFGISETLKSTMQQFFEEEEEETSTQETEKIPSFFDTYVPTFVNPDFFATPTMFEKHDNEDIHSETHQEFFSSFFSNVGENNYSRTSQTIITDGMAQTVTQETFQVDGNKMDVTNEYFHFNISSQGNTQFSNEHDFQSFAQDASIFLMEEEMGETLFDVINGLKSFGDYSSFLQEDSKLNSASKKISKENYGSNIRLTNKKPSKKTK